MVSPPQLLIFLTLTFYSAVRSDTVTENAIASPLRIELDHFRSRISILETSISERVEELKRKDDSIKAMEKNIEDKLGYIASLDIQIESLQKGSPEAEELNTRMYAKSNELSNQADNLRKEIESQIEKKDDLEVRIYTAEKKIKELYQKLESLQKISDEQRTRIRKIKQDIHFAEEKLMKLKIEASLASEEMNQCFVKFQGKANPYIQEAKQFMKPYLTQISATVKLQFDILTRGLKRYTREIVKIYTKVMRSVMAHHTQVQDTVLKLLKGHEYTKPFADMDIVWYLASAIFALPAILLVNLYTSLVR